jgi:hypothetical protein
MRSDSLAIKMCSFISGILPFEFRVFCNTLSDRIELTLNVLLNPGAVDVFLYLIELGMVSLEVLEPLGKFREHFVLMEDLRPVEDSREHEFHKAASREPGHI